MVALGLLLTVNLSIFASNYSSGDSEGGVKGNDDIVGTYVPD